MKATTVLTLLILLFYCIADCLTKHRFRITMNDVKAKTYTKKVREINFYTRVRQNKNYMFYDLTLNQQITHFDCNFSFEVLRKNNQKIRLINIDMDGCKMLHGAYNNTVSQIVYRELVRESNFPINCPLLPHKKYYMYNISISPDDFPPIQMSIDFILMFTISVNRERDSTLILKGRITN